MMTLRPTAAAAAAGESAFAAAGVGTEEAAFAAGFAAAEKKQRRPGPYVPSIEAHIQASAWSTSSAAVDVRRTAASTSTTQRS